MSEIKLTDVIRCSSEDAIHSSSNLLKGGSTQDYWVCSNDNKEPKIEVEFEFAKEAVISFIDIGNHGSQTVDILVSHSTRCRDEFFCLIPTFNFMSVAESKQKLNRNNVQMFKGDDMLSENKSLTWDRLKLVCRQPYANGKQFGLSFICLKTVLSRGREDLSKRQTDDNQSNLNNQNKLNNFFDTLINDESSTLRKPKISMWSSALSSPKVNILKSPKLMENRSPKSPTDQRLTPIEKTPKRVLSAIAIAQFKEEVSCFLEDVDIIELMQAKSIKVSDLRIQMEKQRGLALVRQQKVIFMEIITDRLKGLKQKGNNDNTPTSSNHEVENIDYDVECETCHARLPTSVISIHSQICNPATPIRLPASNRVPTPCRLPTPRNRNQLCFDLDAVAEEKENPKKRQKMNNSETSPTLNNSYISKVDVPPLNSEDRVKTKLCTLLTKGNSNTTVSNNNNINNNNSSTAFGRAESVLSSICLAENASSSDDEQFGIVPNIEESPRRRLSGGMSSELEIVGDSSNEQTLINLSDIEDNPSLRDMETEMDTAECPICFLHIPTYKIAIHASSCEGKMEDGGDNRNDGGEALPELSFEGVNEALEQVQCPICAKYMDKKNIEIHVNICLDFSSSNAEMSSD